MSPFKPDRLYVSIERERIAMVRCRGWLRRQLLSEQIFSVGADERERAAIDWLDRQLAVTAAAGAAVHVVLSDQLVKSFVFESVAGVRHIGELQASIRARFEETFGLPAEEWEISADPSPFAVSFPVCAVERRLFASLQQVFGAHRNVLVSVRPFFVSEFNRWRRRIGRGSAWFAVAERDSLTLARLAEGCWASVRTYRTAAEPGEALPQLLARERLSRGIAADGERVWLAGMPPGPPAGDPAALPLACLGSTVWPERTAQWSRDYRLALSGIWP